MKAKSIFLILLLLICAFIPFQSGVSTSLKSYEVPVVIVTPCIQWGAWKVGQSEGVGDTPKEETTFITNSEKTCCVEVSVKYCENQPTYAYEITDFKFEITMNNGFKVVSLQASCSVTNSRGDTCTVSSFYACASHTHQYPIRCARSACAQIVSTRLAHRIDCSNCGGYYWTCISGATHNHTTVFTCKRPGCGVSFTSCSNGTCTSNWGTHPWHWAQ